MEERLEALQEAWNSFVIEFPTYPKVTTRNKEVSQRILFVCPIQEENPTDLCLALFGNQILIKGLQSEAVLENLQGTRLLFVYSAETPAALRDILNFFEDKVNAPVLLAQKANVVRSAQLVTDFLSRPVTPFTEEPPRPWAEPGTPGAPARIDGTPTPVPEDLWQEGLPEIILTDPEGNVVRAASSLQDYRAEYACRYVLAHFQENINRDKMAEMVNLSPGYFSNLFRAEVGMSFSDYLIQVRIENAKRLLRRFDLSVEAISKQCGFNSLAHFSRTFKDRCGVSPLKFRKNPNSQG